MIFVAEIKRVCKDCGGSFVLSHGEITFFHENNLNLPRRCKSCRSKNKRFGDVTGLMKNSNPGRRYNKGSHVSRSGSTWKHIPDEYIPLDYPSSDGYIESTDEVFTEIDCLKKVSLFLEKKVNEVSHHKTSPQAKSDSHNLQRSKSLSNEIVDTNVVSCNICQHRKGERCTDLSNIPCSDFIALPAETQEQKDARLGLDSSQGLTLLQIETFNPEYTERTKGYVVAPPESSSQNHFKLSKLFSDVRIDDKTCYSCWVRVAGGCHGRSKICNDFFEYNKK